MQRLANIYHLGVKELHSLYRDPVLLGLILWAFTFAIHEAAEGVSQDLSNAPIAVLDEDRSPLSRQIIGAFYGPYFKTPELIDFAAIDPGLDEGRYTFVLDIPSGFQRDLLAGKMPEIQVNVDATRMSQAFIGASYIQNIVNGEIDEFLRGYRSADPLPVEMALRVRFNPTLTSSWLGGVMEIINNITMLSVILTGAALIREREHGTLEHLLVMPLTPVEIMLSKVWGMGLVVLVAATMSLFFVVRLMLEMPIEGSVTLFLVAAAFHLFATTSLGIFLGTLARNMPQFGLLMILVVMPLQMLSGGTTPFESMPLAVQGVMLAAPTTHLVDLSQAVLFRGAGLEIVWPRLCAIFVIGAVFFLAAAKLFRQSLAQQ